MFKEEHTINTATMRTRFRNQTKTCINGLFGHSSAMGCKHNSGTLLSPYKADVDNVDSLFTRPANIKQHQLSYGFNEHGSSIHSPFSAVLFSINSRGEFQALWLLNAPQCSPAGLATNRKDIIGIL